MVIESRLHFTREKCKPWKVRIIVKKFITNKLARILLWWWDEIKSIIYTERERQKLYSTLYPSNNRGGREREGERLVGGGYMDGRMNRRKAGKNKWMDGNIDTSLYYCLKNIFLFLLKTNQLIQSSVFSNISSKISYFSPFLMTAYKKHSLWLQLHLLLRLRFSKKEFIFSGLGTFKEFIALHNLSSLFQCKILWDYGFE